MVLIFPLLYRWPYRVKRTLIWMALLKTKSQINWNLSRWFLPDLKHSTDHLLLWQKMERTRRRMTRNFHQIKKREIRIQTCSHDLVIIMRLEHLARLRQRSWGSSGMLWECHTGLSDVSLFDWETTSSLSFVLIAWLFNPAKTSGSWSLSISTLYYVVLSLKKQNR